MKKRLVALVLATTMVFGGSLAAFADDAVIGNVDGADATADKGAQVTGEAEMNLPIINVTVPTKADIVINPFKMEYTLEDEDSAEDEDSTLPTSTNQVISAAQEISSESNVAVAVNVSDLKTTDVSDGVTIATSSVAKATTKSAFLYLEVIDAADTFGTTFDAKKAVAIPNPTEDGKVKAAAKDSIVVLPKGTEETPSKAKFQIGGDVVANPTAPVLDEKGKATKETVADPWKASDTIKVSFKFTFTPQIVTSTSTN